MDPRTLDGDYLRNVSVLYVEDDEDVRRQLVRFLRHRTGALTVAENGAAGLEAYRSQRPQLVVTDLMMPGMDGLQMGREIRALDPEVPIVVTTAFEQHDYLMRSIDLGVDKYVTKPIDVERLLEALLHCARRLRAQESLARQRALDAEQLRLKHLEAMGVMAGGMAHDYNNLLQVMLGYVSLAQGHAEPGGVVSQLLTKAEAGFVQARELGERLRLFGKGSDLRTLAAPLQELIIGTVRLRSAGSDLNCQFDLPYDLPLARFDQAQMQQVFSALTNNALEAMPSGGTLRVVGRLQSLGEGELPPLPAGDYLHIVFQDSGPGIPPQHLPRIFEPYFTTKEMGCKKGVGLSLALCHAILWKHGGLIGVQSPPGGGAVFHLHLPVA